MGDTMERPEWVKRTAQHCRENIERTARGEAVQPMAPADFKAFIEGLGALTPEMRTALLTGDFAGLE